jgi:hypothetical protein
MRPARLLQPLKILE